MSVNICKVDLLGTISENTNVIIEENNNINRLNLYNEIGNLSNPNLLINGDFQIWQRGDSFVGGQSQLYSADRWWSWFSCNIERNNGSGIKFTVTKEDYGSFSQNIEVSNEMYDFLNNCPLTLSVRIKTNRSITLKMGISDDLKLITTKANTWETHIVTFTPSASSFKTLDNGFSLRIDAFRLTESDDKYQVGDIIEVAWVKLEKGTKATPFVPRSHGEEWMLCRRYYYKISYSQYVVTIDDLKTVYLNDSWMNNHMRYPRSIDKTVTSGVFIQNGTKIVDDNLGSYSYSYSAISFKSSFSSSLTSGVAYFYPKNTTAYFAIDAEIY